MAVKKVATQQTKFNLKEVPSKPRPLWGNEQKIIKLLEGVDWEETGNCGLIFAGGMDNIVSIEDAFALRAAAGRSREKAEAINFYGPYGAVMVTTIGSQASKHRYLTAAGFECLFKFKNPNTRNMVTVWSALTIRP